MLHLNIYDYIQSAQRVNNSQVLDVFIQKVDKCNYSYLKKG